MTDDLVERVARLLAVANGTREDWWRFYEGKAFAVIAFMRPFIRAEALEEAARVAEIYEYDELEDDGGTTIKPSAAIRAMIKERNDE
jgi:hypothetical protein